MSGAFLLYTFGLVVMYIIFFVVGIINLRKYQHYVRVVDFKALLSTSLAKPISIFVPAYNEEKGIIESVRSLLTLQYPQFEVIVINDGSKDQTMDLLIEAFKLVPRSRVYQRKISTQPVKAIYESKIHPHLVVIDKVN